MASTEAVGVGARAVVAVHRNDTEIREVASRRTAAMPLASPTTEVRRSNGHVDYGRCQAPGCPDIGARNRVGYESAKRGLSHGGIRFCHQCLAQHLQRSEARRSAEELAQYRGRLVLDVSEQLRRRGLENDDGFGGEGRWLPDVGRQRHTRAGQSWSGGARLG